MDESARYLLPSDDLQPEEETIYQLSFSKRPAENLPAEITQPLFPKSQYLSEFFLNEAFNDLKARLLISRQELDGPWTFYICGEKNNLGLQTWFFVDDLEDV